MLAGKTIIITGSGSGVGRAAARLFAEAGDQLMLADQNESGVQGTAAIVIDAGGKALARKVDVSNEVEVVTLVEATLEAYGRLDGAHNNASVQMTDKLVEDLTIDDWHRVNAINATGVFLCMKHEIKPMRKSGGGAIVNTASANASVAQPYSGEYVASNHAVDGIMRGAATEAVEAGVRVNAVLPGMINTPIIAALLESPGFQPRYDAALARHTIGRFGEPEDVAYVTRFLLSDQSAFVNGAAIAVDGGYTAC